MADGMFQLDLGPRFTGETQGVGPVATQLLHGNRFYYGSLLE